MRSRIAPLVLYAVFSIVLVVVGDSTFIKESLEEPQNCNCDHPYYLSMTEHQWPSWAVRSSAAIPSPFRYRLLVPFVASLLPFDAPTSLTAVTYASLAVTYFLILMTCRQLGISGLAAGIGLAAAYSSFAHLDLYFNPYMTDGFGLMVLALMTYAFLVDSFWVFAIAALAGVFAREATLLLIPTWCARNLRRGVALSAIAVSAFVVERGIVGPGPGRTLAQALMEYGGLRLQHVDELAIEVLRSWGWVWPLAVAGFILISAKQFVRVVMPVSVLLIAAFGTVFVAYELPRLLGILLPAMAIGTAQLVAAMLDKRWRAWVVYCIAVIVVQFFLSAPNYVRGLRATQLWVDLAPHVRALRLTASSVALLFALGILRHDLRWALREKWAMLSSGLGTRL